MPPSVVTVGRPQRDAAIAAITLAFSTDPLMRFLFPDPAKYLAHMPALVQIYGGGALDHNSAWCIEGFGGAALWLPPGIDPDTEALGSLAQHVPETRRRTMGEVLQRMAASSPDAPYWYLAFIGIDPSRQNEGLGSILMRHANAVLDREGALGHLASTNPRNLPFYQRHGYRLLGTIQVGDCPPISPMLREPEKAPG